MFWPPFCSYRVVVLIKPFGVRYFWVFLSFFTGVVAAGSYPRLELRERHLSGGYFTRISTRGDSEAAQPMAVPLITKDLKLSTNKSSCYFEHYHECKSSKTVVPFQT